MIDSMFPNDSPLRVRRVRNYRVPRYPSHTDPDPTTNPEPVPYPWKSGVAAALLALGETGCGKKGAGVSTEVVPAKSDLYDRIVADVMRGNPKGVRSPFALELGFSGLPYVSGPFGTGVPTPLDKLAAEKLIARICVAEGLNPQAVTFTEEDFTASAQLYDAEKRIGFIIGDEESLGDSAASNWMVRGLKDIASGKEKIEPTNEKKVLESLDRSMDYLGQEFKMSDDQKQELEVIRKLESVRAKANGYLDFIEKLDEPKLSMPEIRHAKEMEEEDQRYLAIISVFDERFQLYDRGAPEFRKRLQAIYAEAQKRKFASDTEKWGWIRQQQAPIRAEMQREQLVKLAQSVREYIAWARRSGLQ